MNIGALNTRCRVEQKSVTIDPDYGTEVVAWVLLSVVWCNLQDELPSRSEAVKNGLAVATQRTRVRMRFRGDLDSSMRLVILRPTAQTYQIVAGPAELGNKDGIEMFCERYSS